MRLLVEEYSDILLVIIGGIVIISIIINSLLSTNITINHFEDINRFNLPVEKIGKFECKDLMISSEDTDLLKHVEAYSSSNIDIKDKVIARIKEDNNHNKYVEYILKYCNDYRIIRAKLYIEEEDNSENNV